MTSPTIAPSTKRFQLPKGRVQPIILALAELQKRPDLSGKFARKLGRIRRVLTPIDEGVIEEVSVVQNLHKRCDAEGKPLPVFQLNQLGQVVFEKDASGKDTDTPTVVPNRFHIKDQPAYEKELKELYAEPVTVECESFTETEFDAFKSIRGDVIDALMDLSEDSEFTRVPADTAQLELVTTAQAAADERSAP